VEAANASKWGGISHDLIRWTQYILNRGVPPQIQYSIRNQARYGDLVAVSKYVDVYGL
jgi:hypothetical protein